MKLYTDKEFTNSVLFYTLFTLFTIFMTGLLFIGFLSGEAIMLGFSIVFFLLSLVMIYSLLKRPRLYRAKLISKKTELIDGKNKTVLIFKITGKLKDKDLSSDKTVINTVKCYTMEENNLIINNNYILKIKELGWKPLNLYEDKNKINEENLANNKVAPKSFMIVFACLLIVIICPILIGIYRVLKSPQDIYKYIPSFILLLTLAYLVVVYAKEWKDESSIDVDGNETRFYKELENITPLKKMQTPSDNPTIKVLMQFLVINPLIWIIINPKLISMQNFPLFICINIPIFVLILYYINYDARLIKKFKVNTKGNFKLVNLKSFKVIRASSSNIFSRYFIIDENCNLLFKIVKKNILGNRYIVCNHENIKIGEIESKIFSFRSRFIINLVDENAFMVRLKNQINTVYQVIGRNYYIECANDLESSIIFDNNKNKIAYLNNNGRFDNVSVLLDENIIDDKKNIDIMMMSFCVLVSNLKEFERKVK